MTGVLSVSRATRIAGRFVSSQPPARVRYGLSGGVALAAAGTTLLLLPDAVHHGLFELLLLPVLVVGLGLGPRSGALALAICAALAASAPLLPGQPVLWDAALLGQELLFVVHGLVVVALTGIARVALRSPMLRPLVTPAKASHPSLAEPLTPREIEVLELAAGGLAPAELAAELYVSVNTVKSHLAHAYAKLDAHNRAEAIARAVKLGLLRPQVVAISRGITPAGDDLEQGSADHRGSPQASGQLAHPDRRSTMSKSGVTRLFVGSVAAFIAAVVLGIVAMAAAFGGGAFVMDGPDVVGVNSSAFTWTMIALAALALVAMICAAIGGLVAWIGALLNTAQLEEKTWFVLLLVLGLLSFGFVAMVAYVLAGPDGTRQSAERPSQRHLATPA
jgi:DNA-binding CsgD family transcriptional regulator